MFPNPWHDPRNEYSPKAFRVAPEPVESDGGYSFYEVLSDHQTPSVLVVWDSDNRPLGQYVTVAGAKRGLQLSGN